VPVVSKGELVYFLRIGESNFLAPPFLLSDLMLGRRNHPILEVTIDGASIAWNPDIGCPQIDGFLLNLVVAIENTSLVFAEDVRCGLITWSCPRQPPRLRDGAAVPDSLKANLDVRDPPHYEPLGVQPRWRLTHARLSRYAVSGLAQSEPPLDLGAFDQTAPQALHNVVLPAFPNLLGQVPTTVDPSPPDDKMSRRQRIQARGAVELKGGLYVLSKNAEPRWFQFTMRYYKRVLQNTQTKIVDLVSLTPSRTPRPGVSVDFHTPDGETI
jgi:hypothetical protein